MILNSTDIVKRHQRDECCLDLCLLVEKQAGAPVIHLLHEKKSETL